MNLYRADRVDLTENTLSISLSSGVDATCLVVSKNGKVSSDADMVFYNQPAAPGIKLTGQTIHIDLGSLRAGAERVVVAASPSTENAPFSTLKSPVSASLTESTKTRTFSIEDLTVQKVVVLVELYRHNNAWRMACVGEGYADGLAGLARDYGVDVDEPTPVVVPGPDAVLRPTFTGPASPPPPAFDANTSPFPAAIAPAPTPLDLSKGRVSLQKGQSVSLIKEGKPLLSKVAMGLGWDAATFGSNIDLDASAIAYDLSGNDLAKVWFMKSSAFKKAIQHSGDNLTGAGSGDDEVIKVDLGALPDEVAAIIFTVNSFSGQSFDQVSQAFCRLTSAKDELVRFDLSSTEKAKGVFMAALVKKDNVWSMTALGEFQGGRTVRAMVKPGRAVVLRLLHSIVER